MFKLLEPKHCPLLLDIVCQMMQPASKFADLLPTAEFHLLIESAIPDLTSLLKDRDSDVRAAGADALSTIAEHCAS
jgi:hypothetical protein